MIEGSKCLNINLSTKAAEKIWENKLKNENEFSKDMRIDSENKEMVLPALLRVMEDFWNANAQDNEALDNSDDFMKYLEESMQVSVPSSEEDLYKKVYDKLLEELKGTENGVTIPLPRLSYVDKIEKKDGEDVPVIIASIVKKVLKELKSKKEPGFVARKLVTFSLQKADTSGKQHYVMKIRKPIGKTMTAQEKTLEKLEELKGRVTYIGKEERQKRNIPRDYSWELDGRPIRTESVTARNEEEKKTVYPTLAAPIGSVLDTLGRLFFDKTSLLWRKNDKGETVINEDSLEEIKEDKLGNTLTIAGLKGLIADLISLEAQLRRDFGEDIVIDSSNFKMVAQEEGEEDKWVIGSVDLLIIDGKGKITVLDMKSNRIWTESQYKDEHPEGEKNKYKYSKQLHTYINILRANGFEVNSTPYVVLFDTYYNNEDSSDSKQKGKKKGDYASARVSNRAIFSVKKASNTEYDRVDITLETTGNDVEQEDQGKTLAEYAEKYNYVTDDNGELVLDDAGNPIPLVSIKEALKSDSESGRRLYIEPRLHIKYDTGTVNALIKMPNIETAEEAFKKRITFKNMEWGALSEEEKTIIEDFMGERNVEHYPIEEIFGLSSSSIESNPELMSMQEIRWCSRRMMQEVWVLIEQMREGQTVEDGVLLDEAGQALALNDPDKTRGKSHSEIISMIGITNIIQTAFNNLFGCYDIAPDETIDRDDYDTEEEYEYDVKRLEKVRWMKEENHYDQLVAAGLNTLLSLERTVVPVRKRTGRRKTRTEEPDVEIEQPAEELLVDSGGNEELETIIDKVIEGLADPEAFLLENRRQSPKMTLSQDIRRLFEYTIEYDDTGNPINHPFWGETMLMNPTKAIQAVLDCCRDCETETQMFNTLEIMAEVPRNKWLKTILDKVKEDKNLKHKFYRQFRKDFTVYSVIKWDVRNGKRVAKVTIVNMKSAFEAMTSSLKRNLSSGTFGVWIAEGEDKGQSKPLLIRRGEGNYLYTRGKYGDSIASEVTGYINKLLKDLENIYKRAKRESVKTNDESTAEERKLKRSHFIEQEMSEKNDNGKDFFDRVKEVLDAIGINLPKAAVENACKSRIRGVYKDDFAKRTLDRCKKIIEAFESQENSKGSIPITLAGLGAWHYYEPLLDSLSTFVQESVEASVYDSGKTYYSYNNPSRLQHTIRRLSDAADLDGEIDENGTSEYDKFIFENYGRYTGWFRSSNDEEWLNDLLKNLITGEERELYRAALQHKVELSCFNEQYRDMGSLTFMRSILHNYFPTEADKALSNRCRWFAVPTMSNKPTNEFVRMLIYGGINKVDDVNDEIVEKVLMPTFQQECNRIADVLYHFNSVGQRVVPMDNMDINEKTLKKEGWTKEEIAELRSRIHNMAEQTGEREERGLTVKEFRKLLSVKSGAKFHFLWYLNQAIEKDNELADLVIKKINDLLVSEEKREKNSISESTADHTKQVVSEVIGNYMVEIVRKELDRMHDIGLFERMKVWREINGKNQQVEVLRYQEEFDGNLGSVDNDIDKSINSMELALANFIWQDIAANINIIQITGGDLAYFGSPENYQKRIAQEHAPGIPLAHDEEYDDGYIRSVYISDEKILADTFYNAEIYLDRLAEELKEDSKGTVFKMVVQDIKEAFRKVNTTDGQSLSGLTSIRKKLALQGLWTNAHTKAYNRIKSGNFDLSDLEVLIQPSKPFVVADMAKLSNSPSMKLRKVTAQMKNSEYLILLAEALSRASGKRSKLTAIYDFMEETCKENNGKTGIDTVHFASVGKLGVGGVIDLDYFDKEFDEILKQGSAYKGNLFDLVNAYTQGSMRALTDKDYSKLLTQYMLMHIRRYNDNPMTPHRQAKENYDEEERLADENNKNIDGLTQLRREEILYNPQFVDTVPISSYIIQQETPEHSFEDERLYGSQLRILGFGDLSEEDSIFEKGDGKKVTEEYKKLQAANILATKEAFMKELGLDKLFDKDGNIRTLDDLKKSGNEKDLYLRDKIYYNIEYLLQKELNKDTNYSYDLKRACSLTFTEDGKHVDDFFVPLYNPIQSTRVQQMLNSIIKKAINKQMAAGNSVVQVTGFDTDLHVRFKSRKKDENGREIVLQTLSEYTKTWGDDNGREGKDWEDKALEAYKEYLRENQAGIAYYECYMVCPSERLEALITKEDGTLMTPEEIKKAAPEVWEEMSKIIGYRIPTEHKYSMMPLKIVGFLPTKSGQGIMMPKEITAITGSDFDIDKVYLFMNSFMQPTAEEIFITRGTENIKQALFRILGEQEDELYEAFKEENLKNLSNGENEIASKVFANAIAILNGDKKKKLTDDIKYTEFDIVPDGIKKGAHINKRQMSKEEIKNVKKRVIEPIRALLLNKAFKKFKDQDTGIRVWDKKARDNRIFELQWAVLTSENVSREMLNPQNFNDQKRVGRIAKILREKITKEDGTLWTWEELEQRYESVREAPDADANTAIADLDSLMQSKRSLSITLPSSKVYFQKQNMQGTQLVGICANANVSHAFVSQYNVYLDLTKNNGKPLSLFGHTIGSSQRSSLTKVDPIRGFDGTLVSRVLGRMLAASVDTAKDTSLKEANLDTFTVSVGIVLVRLGFSYEEMAKFLSQPIVADLSELYFKRKTDGFYDGAHAIKEMIKNLGINEEEYRNSSDIANVSTLTNENLIKHISDTDYKEAGKNSEEFKFQISVLKAFHKLLNISEHLQKLTFCTKFNSISNAVGPMISDTMDMQDKVDDFDDKRDEDCFYEPNGEEDINSAQSILEIDPILNAFFESTMGNSGASEVLFSNFFPHYFEGFKTVQEIFREKYTRNGKLNNGLRDKLLNDYIYYLLTAQTDTHNPVLPTSENDLKYLTQNIVDRYLDIMEFAKNKKYSNALLNNEVGNNCLSVRVADNYIKIPILIFRSGQLDKEGQDLVRQDWTDMILLDDPGLTPEQNKKIKRFGIDLFFYMLMRNGFNFHPRTMMHLATTIVMANAGFKKGTTSFLNGVEALKELDSEIIGSSKAMAERFCLQFVRNHSNITSLAPTFSSDDVIVNLLYDEENESDFVQIQLKPEDMHRERILKTKKGENCEFISVLVKDSETGGTKRKLFRLADKPWKDEGDVEIFKYDEVSTLGVPNQFIQYNANSPLKESFFEPFVGDEEEEEEEVDQKEGVKKEDEDENHLDMQDDPAKAALMSLMYALRTLEEEFGNQEKRKSKRTRQWVKGLKELITKWYTEQDNPDYNKLREAVNRLIDAEEKDREAIYNEKIEFGKGKKKSLRDIFLEQKKC